MEYPGSETRRVAAVDALLPAGVTPPGTRGRILQEALGLFAESGFAGTSIRQIGAAVGINSATLYSHYPSKEHVPAELVRIGHEELHARLAEAAARAESEPPTVRLVALVRAHVLVHADFPLHGGRDEQRAPRVVPARGRARVGPAERLLAAAGGGVGAGQSRRGLRDPGPDAERSREQAPT